MPIQIPNDLPAAETLKQENIFVMNQTRAETQHIRPLEIVLLNLMPTKIVTETQLSRVLGNTPLQVHMELMMISSHKSKNTPEEHLLSFYKTFDELKDRKFDGMVITGAPVFTPPSTSAGAPRRDFTITTAFKRSSFRRSSSACIPITRTTSGPFCSGALTMNSGPPTPGTPPLTGRILRRSPA